MSDSDEGGTVVGSLGFEFILCCIGDLDSLEPLFPLL